MVSAVVLTATGVNADGHREVLGLRVATTESSAAWNGLLADLVARGLGGYGLSPLTPTRAWLRLSPRTCPERPGSAVAPTTPLT